MNRPFGAVDVSANLKGAVPKAATQKILLALAEKGEIVQKTYGAFLVSSLSSLVLTSRRVDREDDVLRREPSPPRRHALRAARLARGRTCRPPGPNQTAPSGPTRSLRRYPLPLIWRIHPH